jgi:hypothetical protein
VLVLAGRASALRMVILVGPTRNERAGILRDGVVDSVGIDRGFHGPLKKQQTRPKRAM